MATLEQNTVQAAPAQEAKVRVTMESASVPLNASNEKQDSSQGLRQILGSLTDARKYIPNQVISFLDSMEGKTIDDLRIEAMQLANKAQEEAKKRAGDVSSYGKDIIDTANQRVQDVADVARDKTNTYIVQPPLQTLQATKDTLQATKEKSKSLAQQGVDKGTSLTFQGIEKGAGLAYRGVNMLTTRFVVPVVGPVAERASEYLPAPAKNFYSSNLAGKSLDELLDTAIKQTRRNLLAVKENDENAKPSLQQIAGEFKDATLNGTLLKNALQLTEKAADSAFGPMETPKDASVFRRTYALGTRVMGGVREYANSKINMATQQAKDMASNRMESARGMVMQRANQVQESVKPIAERIGATPVVPSFLIRMLHPPEQEAKEETTGAKQEQKKQPQMVPATTIRVDIVGTKPEDAPQATSTSKPDTATTTTTTESKTGPSSTMTTGTSSGKDTTESKTGTSSSMTGGSGQTPSSGKDSALDAMRKLTSTESGEAGMGTTTTGGESKSSGGAMDASEADVRSPGGSKSSKHKKHSNKL